MLRIRFSYIFIFLLVQMISWSCAPVGDTGSETISPDESALVAMHEKYVKAWLDNDEDAVMSLMENNSRIQPSALCPVQGYENIRDFWFPKDSSVTTINQFETDIIDTQIMDTLGITTHKSLLDWSYQKDSIRMNVEQRGIATTVYRRQADGNWKIWRQMWTDIYSKTK